MLKHLGKRNLIALLLSIVAFIFLIPGLFLSMLEVQSSGSVKAPMTSIQVQLFDTSNSILQTVGTLFNQGYFFVSVMIFLFSVIVPLTKGIMLVTALTTKSSQLRLKLLSIIRSIAKWSMCDVFVVAVFLAFLSTGSHPGQNETTILGIPIDLNVLVNMSAHLQTGFYCFLTFCLLSLLAEQLYSPEAYKA